MFNHGSQSVVSKFSSLYPELYWVTQMGDGARETMLEQAR